MYQSITEAGKIRYRFCFLPLISGHNFINIERPVSLSTKVNQAFSLALLRTVPGLVPKRCTHITTGALAEKTAVFAAKEVSCQGGQVTGDHRTEHLQMVPRVNTFSSGSGCPRESGAHTKGECQGCVLDSISVCVLKSAAEPRTSPTPRGAAFSQAVGEKVREGKWVGKDAVAPGGRADIPVPGCCPHVSPGHGADSTYPAKADGWVKGRVL